MNRKIVTLYFTRNTEFQHIFIALTKKKPNIKKLEDRKENV